MVQCREAALELFVAHEQLAEAVEPAMADLDDPATGLLAGVPSLRVRLLATIHNVGDVAVPLDDPPQLGAAVPGIGAQVLAATLGGHRAPDRDGFEHLLQALAVIDVSRGHDDRQRDATPVH